MKMFSDCIGECCVCQNDDGCLARTGEDCFWGASKEQIINRLNKGEYPEYREYMIRYLKNMFGYTYGEA